jgi:hypothetical protein
MAAPKNTQETELKKTHNATLAMATAFVLNAGLAFAEEPATPIKPEASPQSEKPTTPKEETTQPKPAENGADKPNQDPNCE